MKRGGEYGAAAYGSYVWGTNQHAGPNDGNVIQVANVPKSLEGGKKKRGGNTVQPTENPNSASNQVTSMYSKMMEPQIPEQINSSTPITRGGRRTKRRGRKQRKSKRKYI